MHLRIESVRCEGTFSRISAVLSAKSAFAAYYRHDSQMHERLGRRNRAEMQE
jgi:hypothetical protein